MSTLSTTNLKNPSSGSNNIVLGTDGSTRVITLADSAGANTSTPAEISSGRAKAWVNFNGTGTVAIRASYNVSSITDNGVGSYTVNFTTALVDANHAVAGMVRFTNGGSITLGGTVGSTTWQQAGSVSFMVIDTVGSLADAEYVTAAIFR